MQSKLSLSLSLNSFGKIPEKKWISLQLYNVSSTSQGTFQFHHNIESAAKKEKKVAVSDNWEISLRYNALKLFSNNNYKGKTRNCTENWERCCTM